MAKFRNAVGSSITQKYVEPHSFHYQKKQFFDQEHDPKPEAVTLNLNDQLRGPKRKTGIKALNSTKTTEIKVEDRINKSRRRKEIEEKQRKDAIYANESKQHKKDFKSGNKTSSFLEEIMQKQGFKKGTVPDEDCLRKLNKTGSMGVTFDYDGEAMAFKQHEHFETIETNMPTITIKTKKKKTGLKMFDKFIKETVSKEVLVEYENQEQMSKAPDRLSIATAETMKR